MVLDEKALCGCPVDGRDLVSQHPLGSEGSFTPSGHRTPSEETSESKLSLWRRGRWRVGGSREVVPDPMWSVEVGGLRRLESTGGQTGGLPLAHQTPCGLSAECRGCRPGTGYHLGPRLWEQGVSVLGGAQGTKGGNREGS